MKNLTDDTWIKSHWRPMMAVVYMITVLFDFLVGPIFWSLIQFYGDGSVDTQWVPITLEAGGFFHVAMGAILGVSALTRGNEKVERIRSSVKIKKYDEEFEVIE